MKSVLHASPPPLIPFGYMGTSTTSQISEHLHSQGGLQIPDQKSWWTQPVCSYSDLTGPQSPRGLTESLSKGTVGGKARNMEKFVFFQVGLPQKQHTTTALSIINWKKYQRIAEVPTLWLGRDLNSCLPVSRGCLLLRAKFFHTD